MLCQNCAAETSKEPGRLSPDGLRLLLQKLGLELSSSDEESLGAAMEMSAAGEHSVSIERLSRRTDTLVLSLGDASELRERDLFAQIRDKRLEADTLAPPADAIQRADDSADAVRPLESTAKEDEVEDASRWAPPAHLIAVDAGSVGEISLVVGKHLMLLANNLVRRGSPDPPAIRLRRAHDAQASPCRASARPQRSLRPCVREAERSRR
eukprot:456698-Prymnesium_polylepis.1